MLIENLVFYTIKWLDRSNKLFFDEWKGIMRVREMASDRDNRKGLGERRVRSLTSYTFRIGVDNVGKHIYFRIPNFVHF